MDAMVSEAGSSRQGGLGRLVVRRIDAHLRRRQGIVDISDHPDCMVRIARKRAPRSRTLADGTRVAQGDPVLELHFRNEHMPSFAPSGPDVAWGREARRRFVFSLRLLAAHVQADPSLSDVVALWAETPIVTRRNEAQFRRVVGRLGLEVEPERPRSIGERLHDMGLSLFMLGMLWTFNPSGVRRDGLVRRPLSVWMSRRVLLRRYGPAGPATG